MSRRRINNTLDLTELEFKEVSNRKLKKFQELAKNTTILLSLVGMVLARAQYYRILKALRMR